jgi:hypothetical protein
MQNDPAILILLYFILPIWLLAGCADWLCHRAAHIATTTGAKESILHLLMFAEIGLPLLAAIFLQINAGIIALMIVAFFIHEATALWDVSYAVTARDVTPVEQHVHSFLEIIPLMAILFVISLHWGQFQSLFGFGPEIARFNLTWKEEPLPASYVFSIMTVILLFELIPYIEEFFRGLRANRGALIAESSHSSRSVCKYQINGIKTVSSVQMTQ